MTAQSCRACSVFKSLSRFTQSTQRGGDAYGNYLVVVFAFVAHEEVGSKRRYSHDQAGRRSQPDAATSENMGAPAVYHKNQVKEKTQ